MVADGSESVSPVSLWGGGWVENHFGSELSFSMRGIAGAGR